jgi:HlyD family secretion protein
MSELSGKINDVEEQSEFVRDVLDKQPSWMLRFGLILFSLTVILVFTFLYFIKYPDILTADITLTTLNPPSVIVVKNSGKLVVLMVKNKEIVAKNQTLAVIENTADYKDVLKLYSSSKTFLHHLKVSDSVPGCLIKDSLKVGELTPNYLQVLKSIKDLALYTQINSYKRQVVLLQNDLVNYNILLAKYRKQEAINTEQLNLSETDYNRDKVLYSDKAISARELETKKKELLNAQTSNEQMRIAVSNCLIQINSIEKNILQLQILDYQDQSRLKSDLQQNFKTLISEIEKWKQLYLIESPVDGRISFFNIWAVNQNIKAGDELFAVVPLQTEEFIGKCALPVLNSGKLQIGQKVNIKLNNYPHEENGMLQGMVIGISEMPNNDNFAIDVKLNQGLITSYKKKLVYKQEMKGKADIITKNISVLERIFLLLKS